MKKLASLLLTLFCILAGTAVTGLAAIQFISTEPVIQSDVAFLITTMAGSIVTSIAVMACARPDWMPEVMTSAFYSPKR